ncbi:MAG TPA: NIPSNAP family protein [Puia sp.]|jgi:hypothetical protein|nr:NIPSNAP family protein [Puia sp.]
MKKMSPGCIVAGLLIAALSASAAPSNPSSADRQEYFAIRVYQLKTAQQEARVDTFLQQALLPALHRQHISGIGVFKPIGNDTAAIRRIYVFIPLRDLNQFASLSDELVKDQQYLADGRSYLNAGYDDPPYVRAESILLKAFPDMPHHAAPWSSLGYSAERVYELRSYEGATESYFANKVQMFNQGGEITLFDKLGFHAVFYASVLSGAHMPNLMYMTSFDNMAARDDHWKTFGADPTWKSLSSSPQYQHNVSHIDDIFLHAAPYSEL